MLTQNPLFIHLALAFVIAILSSPSCTENQLSQTGLMRKTKTELDPVSIIVGGTVGRSSASSVPTSTTNSPVSVIMPTSISAIQSCGVVCGYQYDYAFSIKNTLSESVTVTKIFEEYLATQEDTNSVCSSTWENGVFNSTLSTCGSFNIFANGVVVSSSYTISPTSTMPLSINNTGYQVRVGYIRITITYTKSTGTIETANAVSPTKF